MPAPIDGIYTRIFALRDLASGYQLAWDGVPDESADHVVGILVVLFVLYGPPLVIKADNGAAFIATATRCLLHRHRVHLLLSPAYTPSYNGACEAGNGTIKHHAEALACRHGRPGRWTLDDLEGARLWANRDITDRHQTDTPEERLRHRTPISQPERDQFRQAVDAAAERRRNDQATVATDSRPRTIHADALARQAIADALKGLGICTIRSRPVRLPNPIRKTG